MSERTFGTIGEALAEAVERNLIGPRLGENGSELSVTVGESAARAWLLAQPSARAVDEALARSLTNTCGVIARPRTESRFPPGGGFYVVATGCDVQELEGADRAAAIYKMQTAMTPPTAVEAEGWLVMLHTACAKRSGSEADAAAILTLYGGCLMRYPADVARDACQKLALGKGNGETTWFPTLAEVNDMCAKLVSTRQVTLAALERRDPRSPFEYHDPDALSRQQQREMVNRLTREFAAETEARRPPPAPARANYGTVDETGITPTLRALVERQRADAARQKAAAHKGD